MSALFSDFNLNEKLLRSIDDTGFNHCTPIQEQALSYTINGNDLFAQSQTGTGKTAAFLISIFEIINRSEYKEQALVLVPTRELAVQIEAEAQLLSVHLNYDILSVFGGVGYENQERALQNGVDLVIGTPGRVIDLSNKGILNLKEFTIGVIDEADRMFDMGFVGDIRKILQRMPRKDVRQTMLFSATLDYSVKRLAEEYMFEPMEITIAPETKTVTKIDQQLYHVGKEEKFKLLLGMIKKHSAPRMIIFSNTKRMCEELAGRLTFCGINAEFLTGDLPQKKRQRIVDKFKKHEIPVLIATDVAARGIHIDDLELVINYDIPQHSENYVHRIGRTARAGKSGTALTFACETFVEYLEPVEEYISMKIPSTVACEEDFGEDPSEGKNWKRHLSHNPVPKSQAKKRQDQKNRNNYNQKKQQHKSPHKSKPKAVVSSRNVYTGNPEDDKNLKYKEHRLALDARDKSSEFDAPSRNPYAKNNRRKGSSLGGSSHSGNPRRKQNSQKKKSTNNSSSNQKQTKQPVSKQSSPKPKQGFFKSLFSK